MKLRTKLILAFLVLSVVPLSGITLYSYASSLRAFRATVEREARGMTHEMNARMTQVTAELSQRIDRLGELPYEVLAAGEESEGDGSEADRFVNGLLREMGDSARLVDTLEFVPHGPGPLPEVPPAGAPEPDLMVIKLSGLWSFSGEAEAPSAPSEGPVELLRFGNTSLFLPSALLEGEEAEIDIGEPLDLSAIFESIGVAMDPESVGQIAQAGELGLKIAAQVERHAKDLERARESQARAMAHVRELKRIPQVPRLELKGDFDCPVRRGGEVVGSVKAQVDAGRVLVSVLSRTRTEQGEIPFAVGAEGQIYATDEEAGQTLRDLGVAELYDAPETPGPLYPSGNWVVVTQPAPELGLVFGIARPVGAALEEIRRATGRNLGYGLAMVAAAMLGIVPLSTRMTRSLTALSHGVDRLAGGDLEARVPVRSRDEIGRLGDAFNHMAGQLSEHQRKLVHQERLRKELEMCRQIQEELLPQRCCRLPFAEVHAVTIPARELGGDFFNYFALPDGSMALLMGDVSGKGVPAALLMANLQATLRARLPLENDLARLAGHLDRELEASTPAEAYLTLFVGVVDAGARRMRFVNAGHNTQYVCRADGGLERLESTGRPLGLLPGGDYEERTVELRHGDELCLFTDGLIEAENDEGECFGEPRLEALLQQSRTEQPGEVVARMEEALRQHRGRAEAADDATMLILRLDAGEGSVRPDRSE